MLSKYFKSIKARLFLIGIGLLISFESVSAQSKDRRFEKAFLEKSGYDTRSNDLVGAVAGITQTLLGLLGIIFMVVILYGGFRWLTAAGDNSRVDTAQKAIRNGVIGLAIVLSAYSLSYFIVLALQ